MTGANPGSSITPAVFRQLHVKLPTETFRKTLPKEWFPRQLPLFEPEDHEFEKPDLYHRDYTTENPNELLFSSLNDRASRPGSPQRRTFLGPMPTHYNGGTLSNLMGMYADGDIGAVIPESLIWHVMDQQGRAVLSMRKGCSNDFIEKDLGVDKLLKLSRGEDEQPHPFDKLDWDWKPFAHRAITEDNILLHFREDGGPLTRCFPEIVLEGFNNAGFGNELGDMNAMSPAERMAVVWQDLHMIGELCCRLVTNHGAPTPPRHGDKQAAAVSRMLSKYLPEIFTLADRQKPAYPKELIELLEKFDRFNPSRSQTQVQSAAASMHDLDQFYWKFFFEYLSIAMKQTELFRIRLMRLEELAGVDGEDGDRAMAVVSWVKPNPKFNHIPYHPGDGNKESQMEKTEKEHEAIAFSSARLMMVSMISYEQAAADQGAQGQEAAASSPLPNKLQFNLIPLQFPQSSLPRFKLRRSNPRPRLLRRLNLPRNNLPRYNQPQHNPRHQPQLRCSKLQPFLPRGRELDARLGSQAMQRRPCLPLHQSDAATMQMREQRCDQCRDDS
ncbi:hypothetical protein N657DRAFT_637097 [Parathielavia appendiculata]|uniref:Uncharacterized protein n=1 Tax=Parathielavia appendiculata TaxID=2587402 RepID=A0AAN6YZD4_9PEZI|nr:hypothetical protein N657DRAFT_637097 [Parathielavia appendiculata]